MELTGKAKEDFLKSNGKKEAWINIMLPIYQQALIIEWFDSVGIIINIEASFDLSGVYNRGFDYQILDEKATHQVKSYFVGSNKDCYPTRQEATEQAIIKANQIYNERKQ